MSESALDAKGLQGLSANLGQFFRNLVTNVEYAVVTVIDDVHQTIRRNVAGFKYRISLGIGYGVKGYDLSGYELFHDVWFIDPGIQEVLQVFIALQLIGVSSSNPVVRLYDYRISYFINELFILYKYSPENIFIS